MSGVMKHSHEASVKQSVGGREEMRSDPSRGLRIYSSVMEDVCL